MILLIHGEDVFRSHQRLNQTKEAFVKEDPSGMNLRILEGADLTFEEFKNQVETLPFLAQKRLVIVQNLFRTKHKMAEKILDYIKKNSFENLEIIFYEDEKLDKSFFKKIPREIKVEEFDLLKGQALIRWIEKEVENEGGRIEKAASERLALYVGPDLWQMKNEISKLITFKFQSRAREPVIFVSDVELLVRANFNESIFNLVDAIANKNSRKATRLLYQFLEKGENELSILGMITWQFRNLLVVKDLLARGYSQQEIIKKTGLHPFVVQKTIWQSKNFKMSHLKKVYTKLASADLAIKTGQIEPSLALELLVVGLCHPKQF